MSGRLAVTVSFHRASCYYYNQQHYTILFVHSESESELHALRNRLRVECGQLIFPPLRQQQVLRALMLSEEASV